VFVRICHKLAKEGTGPSHPVCLLQFAQTASSRQVCKPNCNSDDLLVHNLLTATQEAVKYFFGERNIYCWGWTPVPLPSQKGYQSAPFSNGHPSAYPPQPKIDLLSYGAKTGTQTLNACMANQAPTTGQRIHRLLPFLQLSIKQLMLAVSC